MASTGRKLPKASSRAPSRRVRLPRARASSPYSPATVCSASVSTKTGSLTRLEAASDVQIYLESAGVGGHVRYLIDRPSYPEETRFYQTSIDNLQAIESRSSRDFYINFVGLIYLLVGLFVLFKQGGRAPFVFHFATLCLAAFVFHFYKPHGSYEDLDLAVAFLDDAAILLFAPLFLHFCAIYPVRYRLSEKRPWLVALVYVPSLFLILLAVAYYFVPALRALFPESFIGWLWQAEVALLSAALIAGTVALVRRFVKSDAAIVRQQLKWVVWGSALAVTPFTLLYAVGYVTGGFTTGGFFSETTERWLTDAAILPLALIPLTFGNSVVRYRLMDVDMVVRRTAVYVLTTLAIALMLGTVVYVAGLYAFGGEVITPGLVTMRVIVAVVAMAVIVMTAAPLKNFLQEQTDRFFYGETYDLRHGLLDFGRTLSATTTLDPLLDALVGRLQQVLSVERIAIFIEDAPRRFGVSRGACGGLVRRCHRAARLPRDDSHAFG